MELDSDIGSGPIIQDEVIRGGERFLDEDNASESGIGFRRHREKRFDREIN